MVKHISLTLIGLVSVLSACAAPASESESDNVDTASQAFSAQGGHNNPKYLALGDSVPFGYNPTVPFTPPWSTFVGYPEKASDELHWGVTNASCPGETTASFLSASGFPDTGCHHGGLKADYTKYGATTQIDYATAYLKDHRDTKLVTITIAGNDLQLPFYLCGALPLPPPPSAFPCIQAQLPAMFASYQQNLDTILGKIRASGYKKDLVVVNQYALNYADPALTPLIVQINAIAAAVAAQHKATVSDSFAAFQKASASFNGDACAAGLLIPLPGGGCDLHPTPKGAEILARTLTRTVEGCGHDD
jgi:lysophospholipase L1-like esterase